MTGLRLLAVDDERPALADIARMLGDSPAAALRARGGERFDALFLDVRMPGLDGLELARVLRRFERPPALVFVSAHDDFAVAAFELAALDYLVKPVSRRRLDEAVERVVRAVAAPAGAAAGGGGDGDTRDRDVLPVDAPRGGTRLVPRSAILFLQAHGDYVRVVSDEGRFLLRARLAELEERWEDEGFLRVHRGFVVNLRRAVEVRPRLNGTAVVVMADGAEVPVARRQVADLRRKLSV